jgi:hypothetical protein
MQEPLEAKIRQLVGNKLSGTEIPHLLSAIATGQATLATGKQAVSVGSSANDAVIITGDRNILIQIQGLDAATLQALQAILSQHSDSGQTAVISSIDELVQQVRRKSCSLSSSSIPIIN